MTTTPEHRRAVYLDRDGVLNDAIVVDGNPRAPRQLSELTVRQSTVGACALLREAGLLLVVATNQPELARGTQSREAVEQIHVELRRMLCLDVFMVCPHDDADGCQCRKPRPGMLLESARALDIDLRGSVMVGDRWRDVEAGRRAGCATVFIDNGYSEKNPEEADVTVTSLAEAVPWILQRTGAA